MYISQSLVDTPLLPKALSNQEFLVQEIRILHNIFSEDMIAIKDHDLNYIAFSSPFADEFNLSSADLGTFGLNSCEIVNEAILEQERQIIADSAWQDSLFFYKKQNKLNICGIRKRRLINPHTTDVVGIFIVIVKFEAGFMRKQLLMKLTQKANTVNRSAFPELSQYQHSVIFCILSGFQSRKEIAEILHGVDVSESNENKVKKSLQMLYHKFECSSTTQLLSLVANDWFNIKLPLDSVLDGSNCPLE